jgi:hypothetical protein
MAKVMVIKMRFLRVLKTDCMMVSFLITEWKSNNYAFGT